ncbi:hypothetical protein MJG53_020018 [Ovis ammon polii x Ovis aries]|uniref:Uncharacterized protein n=1 Tax=Ovis ammon polii x Ovis aries TaxID=2918886 RepID=A0ACB9U160_9CETA|nr:hypothetical protein MJG53_020018 [Ovis ammon polii x Ovis aries]
MNVEFVLPGCRFSKYDNMDLKECQEVKGLKHLSAKILGLTGGQTDDIWDGSPGMEVFWPTSNDIGRRDSGNVEEALGWIPRLEKLGETFSKDFGTDWWSSHDILEGSQGMKGFCRFLWMTGEGLQLLSCPLDICQRLTQQPQMLLFVMTPGSIDEDVALPVRHNSDTMDLAFHARFHSQALFHTAADMVCSSTSMPRLETLGAPFCQEFGTDWWSSCDIRDGSPGTEGFWPTNDDVRRRGRGNVAEDAIALFVPYCEERTNAVGWVVWGYQTVG